MQLWDVKNYTPFAAFGGFERDHTAESFWCIWIKAEFNVSQDGRVSWVKTPDLQISPTPVAQETDAGDMMLQEADIGLPRTVSDISLIGQAPVAAGTTAPIVTQLSVGDWQKRVEVHPAAVLQGNRIVPDPAPDQDETVPLDWTEAFGGKRDETDIFALNPLGTGYDKNALGDNHSRLPRLRYPGDQMARATDILRPVSYLPVPQSWEPRRSLAGTFNEEWTKTRAPLLPLDHNPDYRSSVPEDQRYPGFLTGGEEVAFQNIAGPNGTAPAPFVLPETEWEVETQFNGAWVPMKMKVQSLVLEPGQGKFSILWAGAFPIGSPANDVKVQQTTIVLRGSSGFSVTAEDAGLFGEEQVFEYGAQTQPDAVMSEVTPDAGHD